MTFDPTKPIEVINFKNTHAAYLFNKTIDGRYIVGICNDQSNKNLISRIVIADADGKIDEFMEVRNLG